MCSGSWDTDPNTPPGPGQTAQTPTLPLQTGPCPDGPEKGLLKKKFEVVDEESLRLKTSPASAFTLHHKPVAQGWAQAQAQAQV